MGSGSKQQQSHLIPTLFLRTRHLLWALLPVPRWTVLICPRCWGKTVVWEQHQTTGTTALPHTSDLVSSRLPGCPDNHKALEPYGTYRGSLRQVGAQKQTGQGTPDISPWPRTSEPVTVAGGKPEICGLAKLLCHLPATTSRSTRSGFTRQRKSPVQPHREPAGNLGLFSTTKGKSTLQTHHSKSEVSHQPDEIPDSPELYARSKISVLLMSPPAQSR